MSARFHIRARGDRTIGDGDHYAEVEIPFAVNDPEYLAFVREQLITCFSAIFDSKARVLTDEEYQKEETDD